MHVQAQAIPVLSETIAPAHYPVIVIGGGQAGLSISYLLQERGVTHLVLEKNRVAESWRSRRWDTFCLVTPNWQCQLPGFPYAGQDPDGFMLKEQIVQYLESYRQAFNPPLREGVSVTRLRRGEEGGFELTTSEGTLTADQVVIATGGYQEASMPRMAERFPASLHQIHSSDYKNPAQLPPGAVLVIGSGQSGCQIAEDLHLAGRQVHLCVGGAPRTARRYRGRDVVAWLDAMGYYSKPIDEHPQKERVRAKANHYVTGRDGGRDIDLRRFACEGMQLHGRLKNNHGSKLHFAHDLRQNLDQADVVSESIKATIDKYITSQGIDAPAEPPYEPLWQPPAEEALELDYETAGITSFVWSVGFHSDYRWIELPIFEGSGYPGHERGITPVPGLYFLGLPWQHTWGSGRFSGVAQDARHLMEKIAERQQRTSGTRETSSAFSLNEWALGS